MLITNENLCMSNKVGIKVPLINNRNFHKIISNNIKNGKYRYIGSGSSRRVYDLNNGYVIKIAKNKAGVEQNKAEYMISEMGNYNIFAKVICAISDYNFIVMKKGKKIKSMSYIWKYFNVEDEYDFFNLPIIKSIKYRYGLVVSDLARTSSWAIVDGTVRIIDFGFTRKVKKEYYDK